MAAGADCSVCSLDAKPRKIGELLLREGLGVRDVAMFGEWWAQKNAAPGTEPPKAPSKSAWDRHKAHFVTEEQHVAAAGDAKVDLESLVEEMLSAWVASRRDSEGRIRVPADAELRKWLETVGKLEDVRRQRREDEDLKRLLEQASFRPPGKEDIQTT